jgi:hypothetical protein
MTSEILAILLKKKEVVTYAELAKAIRADPQTSARGALNSARRIAVREHAVLYECVRGEGLKLVTGDGVADVGRHSITKIHREASRGVKKLACADPSKMSNNGKVRFNAVAAGLGAMALMSQGRQVKRLESAAATVMDKPTLKQTLTLFGANGEAEEK